jgi:hypothetical protein
MAGEAGRTLAVRRRMVLAALPIGASMWSRVAQAQDLVFSGIVVDASQAPVPGARVMLLDGDRQLLKDSHQVDAKGAYQIVIPDFGGDRVAVTASGDGYDLLRKTVDVKNASVRVPPLVLKLADLLRITSAMRIPRVKDAGWSLQFVIANARTDPQTVHGIRIGGVVPASVTCIDAGASKRFLLNSELVKVGAGVEGAVDPISEAGPPMKAIKANVAVDHRSCGAFATSVEFSWTLDLNVGTRSLVHVDVPKQFTIGNPAKVVEWQPTSVAVKVPGGRWVEHWLGR